jgi:hypothetical protein
MAFELWLFFPISFSDRMKQKREFETEDCKGVVYRTEYRYICLTSIYNCLVCRFPNFLP